VLGRHPQARLLDVFEQTAGVRRERRGAERVLAVLRSDYMLHAPTSSLLQVELNTIASSFGCLSTLVARMHRHLLGRLDAGEAELAALPQHNAMDSIAAAPAFSKALGLLASALLAAALF
jgi:glutathione synthase